MSDTTIPVGFCQCGCGKPAPIAKRSYAHTGAVKGQPVRYIRGHNPAVKISNPVLHRPDGTSVLTLMRGSKPHDCVVDTADYPLIEAFRWHVTKHNDTFYASTSIRMPNGSWAERFMHRLLLPNCEEVGHVDHNGLNNRRLNLRPATHSENQQNKTKTSGNHTAV